MVSIDEVARRAGRDLRASAGHRDVETALADLHRVAPRRRRAHIVVGVVAAVVVCAALAGLAGRVGSVVSTTGGPAERTPDHSPSFGWNGLPRCGSAELTCSGGRRYTIHLDEPVSWTLPRGFDAPYSGTGWHAASVESYLEDAHRNVTAGVTVLEHAEPFTEPYAGPDAASWTPTTTSPLSAAELASWIAQRPFVSAGPVRATALAGRPAWSVGVVVRPHQRPGPETCHATTRCYPLLAVHHPDGPGFTGVWRGLTSRFIVLELPRAGTAVVWAWSFDPSFPAPLDRLLASLRFG